LLRIIKVRFAGGSTHRINVAAVTRLISAWTKTSNKAAEPLNRFDVAAGRHWSWVHESARFA